MFRTIIAAGVGSMLTMAAHQITTEIRPTVPGITITAFHSVVIQAGQAVVLDDYAVRQSANAHIANHQEPTTPLYSATSETGNLGNLIGQ